jgi:hypothetical protein
MFRIRQVVLYIPDVSTLIRDSKVFQIQLLRQFVASAGYLHLGHGKKSVSIYVICMDPAVKLGKLRFVLVEIEITE